MGGENSSLIAGILSGICATIGSIIVIFVRNYLTRIAARDALQRQLEKSRDDAVYHAESIRLEGGWAKFVEDLKGWSAYVERELEKCRMREHDCIEKYNAQVERMRDMEERMRRMEGRPI